jgi:steroid 5-alpha reductase family enzyme
MINWHNYFCGFIAIIIFALSGWLLSLIRKNVTHVDSMWSLFLLISAFIYTLYLDHINLRVILVLFLLSVWALRLCLYLTWRNWGPHEDHRYAAIRKNNQPHFWFSSLYIVFGLQALLAWIISMPLFGAIESNIAFNYLDVLGIVLFAIGFIWEVTADWQLSVFKAEPHNHGKVLDTGVWRYCRHPNYFGECCVWWGFYLIALAAGAWWSLVAPLLMTLLLLKVSGVALLEKDIAERRPAYLVYIKSTNAFIPWLPKRL